MLVKQIENETEYNLMKQYMVVDTVVKGITIACLLWIAVMITIK